jgi:hypothetical protein
MLIAVPRVGEREKAMDSFLAFAVVATAIIASMGLAMWMEWYCLRWLMRMMPGQPGAGRARSTAAAVKENEEAEFAEIEPELADAELVAAPVRARGMR